MAVLIGTCVDIIVDVIDPDIPENIDELLLDGENDIEEYGLALRGW